MLRRKFPTKDPIVMDIMVAGKCQLVDMLIQNQLIYGHPKRASKTLKSPWKLPDLEGKEGACL